MQMSTATDALAMPEIRTSTNTLPPTLIEKPKKPGIAFSKPAGALLRDLIAYVLYELPPTSSSSLLIHPLDSQDEDGVEELYYLLRKGVIDRLEVGKCLEVRCVKVSREFVRVALWSDGLCLVLKRSRLRGSRSQNGVGGLNQSNKENGIVLKARGSCLSTPNRSTPSTSVDSLSTESTQEQEQCLTKVRPVDCNEHGEFYNLEFGHAEYGVDVAIGIRIQWINNGKRIKILVRDFSITHHDLAEMGATCTTSSSTSTSSYNELYSGMHLINWKLHVRSSNEEVRVVDCYPKGQNCHAHFRAVHNRSVAASIQLSPEFPIPVTGGVEFSKNNTKITEAGFQLFSRNAAKCRGNAILEWKTTIWQFTDAKYANFRKNDDKHQYCRGNIRPGALTIDVDRGYDCNGNTSGVEESQEFGCEFAVRTASDGVPAVDLELVVLPTFRDAKRKPLLRRSNMRGARPIDELPPKIFPITSKYLEGVFANSLLLE